ncbi:MAG TPA: GNAT family N-acetyltransferase [Longimicrobiales bacterium]
MNPLPVQMTDEEGEPFRLRRYEPADRASLQAMYEGFEPKGAAQGLPPRAPLGIRRWLDRVLGRGEHVVAEAGGRVVGHAMLIPMDDGGAELATFVDQAVRDRGIGTALNRVIVDVAREAGYRRVWLCVTPSNRAALRSYRKAGFRLVSGALWMPEVEMEVMLR